MKYSYRFTKTVEKFLAKQTQDFLKNFIEKVEILTENPFQNNLDIKPLKGLDDNYRLRIGKYRFLYEIQNQELCIYFYTAGSRGDVYK